MASNLKLIDFMSLALVFLTSFQSVSSFDYEEYFRRSILSHLEDKNGSFICNLRLKDSDSRYPSELSEKFNFEENAGGFKGLEKNSEGKINVGESVNMNNLKEIYMVDHLKHTCKNNELDENIVDFFKTNFIPRELIIESENDRILGNYK